MPEAVVIKSTGSRYDLMRDDGVQVTGIIRGKFRLNGWRLTNPVAVGDIVEYTLEKTGDEEIAIIKKIHGRKNYVVRQSPRKKHHLHLLASNIDQAVLVVTIVQPMLKVGFIDRFLLMTEPHDIPVAIIFNKSDLYHEGDLELFEYLKVVYENIGYQCLLHSNVTGEGTSEIYTILQGKVTLVAGQSGVGKSTLLNKMQPGLNIRTDELSDYTGKGQHTTTFAQMYVLNENTKIIDTPGIKTLGFNNLEPMDVAHNFREIFAISKNCKFHDCSHRKEPKCAVKEAVAEGYVSELRYNNYLQILMEIEDQNYWERLKEM